VGIIAVDPTSPFTGGAILGDRIRMQSRSLDAGTFIRSMATRGHLGGLARTTGDVLTVLDAAGFDVVLVETVGVGQDEVEIVRTAHATVVLLVPGMGDDIQAMKAGIMEIGDVFIINKADRPGVERIEAEVRALLSMCARADGWVPAVVRTIASEGKGIAECVQSIEDYRNRLAGTEYEKSRSVQTQRDRLLELVRTRILQRLVESPEAQMRLTEMAASIAARQLDPFTAAEQLLASGFSKENAEATMFKGIDHIGIAVRSIEKSLPLYSSGLGLPLRSIEQVEEQKTRVAALPIGDGRLELLEAMGEESPIARFIAKRGEGLHHVCFSVDDISAELARLKAAGVRLIDDKPRLGAGGCLIAFVHPESASGVLIELSEPAGDGHKTSSK
jgi:LAO/AO transport system kinase